MNRLSPNLRAILAMTAACAAFIVNDTLIKMASASLPMGQIMCLRGLVGTTLLCLFILASGMWRQIPTLRHPTIALRTLAELGATGIYLPALFHLPIATSTVIAQTTPLAVTAAAAIFFGEPVGWRRWSAIAVGFVGVLIVARPGADGLNIYALLALGSVAFIAFRDLVTHKMPVEIPSLLATAVAAIAVTLCGAAIGLSETWVTLDAGQWLMLSVASICLMTGYFCIIAAMRVGEIAVAAPFRYTIIPFAILLGFVVWHDVPDLPMLLGTAIIFAAGLYTFYRERVRTRIVAAPSTSPVPS